MMVGIDKYRFMFVEVAKIMQEKRCFFVGAGITISKYGGFIGFTTEGEPITKTNNAIRGSRCTL
jgi:hypothetical protein